MRGLPGQEQRSRIILCLVSASWLVLLQAVLGTVDGYAFECRSTTYAGTSFETEKSKFSPYDKIYVKVVCKDLEKGNYSVVNNWIHTRRGLVRSNNDNFSMAWKQDHTMYFWFKLSQKGPLKSAFTNEDFNENYFGEWVAETVINDVPAVEKSFIIQQGD